VGDPSAFVAYPANYFAWFSSASLFLLKLLGSQLCSLQAMLTQNSSASLLFPISL
jgi:hypothetical protein